MINIRSKTSHLFGYLKVAYNQLFGYSFLPYDNTMYQILCISMYIEKYVCIYIIFLSYLGI